MSEQFENDEYNEKNHPCRNTCDFLRSVRMMLAEKNGIEFKPAECHNTKPCKGTCPVCDAECQYLEEQLIKKAESGGKIYFGDEAYTSQDFSCREDVVRKNYENYRTTIMDFFDSIEWSKKKLNSDFQTLTMGSPIRIVSDHRIKVDSSVFLSCIRDEHPQTKALILAFLSSQQAGEILSGLSPEEQYDVIHRLATMDKMDPEVRKKVEEVLSSKLSTLVDLDGTVLGDIGIGSVADILGTVDANIKKDIMERLRNEEPELAHEICLKMIDFEDILLLKDEAIKRIPHDLNDNSIAIALIGASEEAQNIVFKDLSEDRAELVKNQMEVFTPVHMKYVDEAQQNTVDTMIKLGYGEEIVKMKK